VHPHRAGGLAGIGQLLGRQPKVIDGIARQHGGRPRLQRSDTNRQKSCDASIGTQPVAMLPRAWRSLAGDQCIRIADARSMMRYSFGSGGAFLLLATSMSGSS
jgi:hypothetical protein